MKRNTGDKILFTSEKINDGIIIKILSWVGFSGFFLLLIFKITHFYKTFKKKLARFRVLCLRI